MRQREANSTGRSPDNSKRRTRDKLPSNVLRLNLAEGRHSDGAGLYLTVKGASRSWVFMFASGGKRREMGLGPAGDPPAGRPSDLVSLKAARVRADELRAIVADGGDPLVERDRAAAEAAAEIERQAAEAVAAIERARAQEEAAKRAAITFGQVADAYVAGGNVAGQSLPGIAGELRNSKHVDQWKMTLGDKYCRKLRQMPVAEVGTTDVQAVLAPIWTKKAETASRIRGRIERVLDAAETLGLRTGANPARWRGHLANILPKRQKLARGHHAALPWRDVPAFVERLRGREGIAALALEFLILTAARSGEVRGMTWDEVDLDAAHWTVPASRMKAGRIHRVPLTERAAVILDEVKPLAAGDGLVFPGLGGRMMSDMTLAAVLKRMKADGVTVHGFRSSFRDWVFEATTFPSDLAEAALAHVHGTAVERAYRRGDALDRRRELMNAWATYIDGGSVGRVIQLRPARGEGAGGG